ncbi:hypothetical protein [Glacieibacterium sp.]|uniref:hypothetical protein n=1 Tax=Glacieibacterium sp. TaxID=2860237 RepID=UPI003B00B8C9
MTRSILLVLLLSACAPTTAGPWPSLARRPGEAAPLVPRPAAPPAVAASAAAPADTGDASARLSSIERDITSYEARLKTQLATTAAAVAKRGAARTGDDAAAAEVEATRLERLGGQAGDLRERLNALAGDLARRGADPALLARTGKAIDRIEALRAEQAKGFAAARR